MAKSTATALYHSYASAAEAVGRLEAAGIPHDDISIVSNDETQRGQHGDGTGTGTGASLGTVVGGGAGLLAGLGLLAIPGLGPVVAAGWLASTLVGAGVGAAAGGLVGSLTDAGIDHADADAYAEGVRRGGTLVTVRADDAMLARAAQIMDVDGATDLDERRTAWGRDGWTPGATTAGGGIADGLARAKDAVERTGSRIADAVTPDRTTTTTGTGLGSTGTGIGSTGVGSTGVGSTGTVESGAMGTGLTGGVDRTGRRVRTY